MSDSLRVDKVESKGYGIIYKLPMQDKDLDVVAKAFYAYICSYAGAGDTAFPGMDKICSDLGVSRQRLERHRKVLVDKGYITINKIKENGRFSRNEYKINKSIPWLQNATTEITTTEITTTENVTTNNNSINNNSINNNNTNKNTSRHKYETCDMESAQLLYQLMCENNQNTKSPNFEKWANDIRMIREIDKYTTEQIDYMIRWTQRDSFWMSNILSPAKLRKQFAGLVVKMKAQNERKQQYQKPINPWEEYMYEQAGSGSITNDDKRGVSERIKFIE